MKDIYFEKTTVIDTRYFGLIYMYIVNIFLQWLAKEGSEMYKYFIVIKSFDFLRQKVKH